MPAPNKITDFYPNITQAQHNSWAKIVAYIFVTMTLQRVDFLLAAKLDQFYVMALSNIYIVYLIALKKVSSPLLLTLLLAQLLTAWTQDIDMRLLTGIGLAQCSNLIFFQMFLNRYHLIFISKHSSGNQNTDQTNNIPDQPPQPHKRVLLKNFTRICCAWLVAASAASVIFGFISSDQTNYFLLSASTYWLANICTFIALIIPIMTKACDPANTSAPQQPIKAHLITTATTCLFLIYCLTIITTTDYPFIYILLPLCLLAVRLPVGPIAFIVYVGFAGTIAFSLSLLIKPYFSAPRITPQMLHTMCITGFIPLFFAFMVTAFEKRQRYITKLSERMSLANKAIGLGVWEWRISTRNVWWDNAMYDLYGLTQQPMTYARWRQCIHPEDVSQLERLLKNMARSKNEFKAYFRIIHPVLGIRHIQAAATIVYGDNNQPLRYVGMNWDITNLKSAEIALHLAKQKAEAASHIKSEFVANMSHEIRTPLNAALGAAQLLQNTQLSVPQKKYANMIKQSGESLLAIVNDILDFSKIESGHANLAVGIFNIRDTAQTTANILSPQAGAKGLEFILHIDKNVPTFVEGDALKLHQVLINLTSNAIRFTPGGEVRIEITAQKLPLDKLRLNFAVIDTGIGIAKNKQLNLFDAFTQVDSSSTRQYGGTGLGLAIAKRLVKLMGGELQLESDEGLGALFHFSLELKPIAQRNFTHPLENQPLRVLLIEQNPRVIDSVKHMVVHWPWDLIAAGSADQALCIFSTANNLKPIDLLIIDSRELNQDSQPLVSQLIKLGLAPTCLRLVSDISHQAQIMSAAAMDLFDSQLIKPFTPTGLLDAIQDGRNLRLGINKPIQHEMNLPAKLLDGITLLLVEDNPLNQVVAKGLLEQFGARIDQAWNGREALELISKNPDRYQVILLDIQMPVMDGYSTCHALNERGNKTPIIAMTAGVLSSEQAHCEHLGMQGFVPKPIEIQTLLTEIQKLIPTSKRTNPDVVPVIDPIENTLFYPERLLHHITEQAQAQSLVKGIEQLVAGSQAQHIKLESIIAASDYSAAAKILHGQKGAWGNLGAKPLYRQLCSLETLAQERRLNLHCRQWQAYSQLFNQTRKEAEDWLARQVSIKPATSADDDAQANTFTVLEFIQQLTNQSLKACENYIQMRNSVAEKLDTAELELLDAAINNLEFVTAAMILRHHYPAQQENQYTQAPGKAHKLAYNEDVER